MRERERERQKETERKREREREKAAERSPNSDVYTSQCLRRE